MVQINLAALQSTRRYRLHWARNAFSEKVVAHGVYQFRQNDTEHAGSYAGKTDSKKMAQIWLSFFPQEIINVENVRLIINNVELKVTGWSKATRIFLME